jgi:hypothetical protein
VTIRELGIGNWEFGFKKTFRVFQFWILDFGFKSAKHETQNTKEETGIVLVLDTVSNNASQSYIFRLRLRVQLDFHAFFFEIHSPFPET